MENEIILSKADIPIKIQLINLNGIQNIYDKDLRILYNLKGNLYVEINSEKYKVKENEWIIINSYEFGMVQSKEIEMTMYFEITIDTLFINKLYKDFSHITFHSFLKKDKFFQEIDMNLKKYIYEILKISIDESTSKNLMILEDLMKLIMYLINNLKVNKIMEEKTYPQKKRIIDILNYIEENYSSENLTTLEIAEHVNLSQQHLLKIFRENFNVTLSDYINSLRIRKSLSSLIYTNKAIIEIAIENGFNDNKNYTRVFKKQLGLTPGNFRNISALKNIKYSSYDKNQIELKNLIENIGKQLEFVENVKELNAEIINIDLEKVEEKKITHYWNDVLYIGEASEIFQLEIQKQISQLKFDLNPKYAKITGILNDELNIYNENNLGITSYNFIKIGKIIDFLLNQKMKPFINIGFMPKKLAEQEIYIFSSNINVSFPKEMEKWKLLINSLIRYFVEKYGEEEVLSWYFEIWENPHIKKLYWDDLDERFFVLFKETYNSIKEVSSKIKVGSPKINYKINKSWTKKFFDYIKKENISLDFISLSYYEINNLPQEKNSELINEMIKTENQFYNENNSPKVIIQEFKNYYSKNIDIIISEWNYDILPNINNDNCKKNIFIVNEVVKNLGSLKYLVYSNSLEVLKEKDIFNGNTSFYLFNKLKKSSLNAFILLNKLGTILIEKGKNYCITRKNEEIQILLYGNEKDNKEIILKLENLKNGKYQIKKFFLNSQSGSVYEEWEKMGKPSNISNDIYDFLRMKGYMNIKFEELIVENEILSIKERLEENSIVLMEIK